MVKQLGDRTTVVQSLQSPFRLHEPPSAEQQGGCKKIAMFIQNKLNKCLTVSVIDYAKTEQRIKLTNKVLKVI